MTFHMAPSHNYGLELRPKVQISTARYVFLALFDVLQLMIFKFKHSTPSLGLELVCLAQLHKTLIQGCNCGDGWRSRLRNLKLRTLIPNPVIPYHYYMLSRCSFCESV